EVDPKMGIKWAKTEGLPDISIPPKLPEADIPAYVADKQKLQAAGVPSLRQEVQEMATPKKFGPEFDAQQHDQEIMRNREILRNDKANAQAKENARTRL